MIAVATSAVPMLFGLQ